MSERQRLGLQDALWLEMDRPANLMVVDSLLWTASPVDWNRFRSVARERLWDRYRVFRSVAVRGDDGTWYWEESSGATVDDHIEHVVLAEPGDAGTLQQFVGALRTVPLDRDKPLWKVMCVDGFEGGSAVVIRIHHAIADGIRLVQLAMSFFDATPDGGAILAPAVHLHAAGDESPGPSARQQVMDGAASVAKELLERSNEVAGRMGEVVTNPVGVTSDELDAAARVVAQAVSAGAGASVGLARTAVTNPLGAAHSARTLTASGIEAMSAWLRSAMRPPFADRGPLVDFFSAAPGDADVARKLLIGTRNETASWTGTVGTNKAVAWSAPLPLAEVKAVARANQATVNDVLVTCVACTLHAYLTGREETCGSVNWMIPVNLKPLDATLPEELGNSFAIVQLELPTNEPDPLAVLAVVRRRMGRIKSGHEAAIAFRIQEMVSGMSTSLYRATVDLLANRAVGVLTNVPGPPVPVYVAGERVTGMVGWAPLSGNQPMSFTIYTYDGQVFVGIACDTDLVPDHHQIVDGYAVAFRRLVAAST